MDSTLPLLPSSKLPIKRKTPDNSPVSAAGGGVVEPGSDSKNPPFKFHRIWTEPDEIRFLQGLLNGSSDNLVFPRDLNVFYTRFSSTMSQPYTKSQLSEKLRRLRKKFRVISSRLVKGLDMSLLSPHDRELYHLSKQLWHPDFAHTSPFNADKCKKIYVSDPGQDGLTGIGSTQNEENVVGDGKLREVNVELDRGEMGGKRVEFSRLDGPLRVGVGYGIGIGDIAAKVVMDVFDECLKDFRDGVVGERSNLGTTGQSDAQRSNLGGCGNEVVGERSNRDDFGNGVVGERSNLGDLRDGFTGERLNLGDFRNGVVDERSNFDDFGNTVVDERSNLDGLRNEVVGERSNLGDFTNGVVGERSNVDGFRNGVVREGSNIGDFTNGVVGQRSNLGGFMKEASLDEFEVRWREQRVAELDVLARRIRLVFEHSLQSQ
ncbi:unnamed protein product [Withania somnifera]